MTRVMIVEDNETLRDTVAFELEMQGYEVIQAANGQKALELLISDILPDIVVSDIAMPDINGYELLETIRKNENLKLLPVLFLTASSTTNAVQLGKNLGVDDYLIKPFDPDDLIAAIESKLRL